MNIFTQLLPGLRDLRTPLAVGYVWLLALYFGLAGRIPEAPAKPTGFYGDIYRLSNAAGPAVTLAAISFMAYLLGILSVQLQVAARSRLRQALDEWLDRGPRWLRHERGPSIRRLSEGLTEACVAHVARLWDAKDEEAAQWRVWAADRLTSESGTSESAPRIRLARYRLLRIAEAGFQFAALLEEPRVMGGSLRLRSDSVEEQYGESAEYEVRASVAIADWVRDLYDELPRLPDRLLGKDADLWSEWDKRRAEAEFRLSLAVPVFALGIVLGSTVHPAWLLMALVSALLIIGGLQQEAAAAHVLLSSVAAGRIESQALSRREYNDLREVVETRVEVQENHSQADTNDPNAA